MIIDDEKEKPLKEGLAGLEGFHDYLFHYNPYTETWNAFKRENSSDYFNGKIGRNDIIRAKDINHIFSYLFKNLKLKSI